MLLWKNVTNHLYIIFKYSCLFGPSGIYSPRAQKPMLCSINRANSTNHPDEVILIKSHNMCSYVEQIEIMKEIFKMFLKMVLCIVINHNHSTIGYVHGTPHSKKF